MHGHKGYIPKSKAEDKARRSWRYLDDASTVYYAVIATASYGGSVIPLALAIDFGPQVAKQAAAHGFDWLRRLIVRHIEHALRRRAYVVLVRDYTDGGRLHVHGAMTVRSSFERKLVITALRNAAGEWLSRQHKDRQIYVEKIESERRWANYLARKAAHGFSMTNPLRARAKQLHRHACQAASEKVTGAAPQTFRRTHKKAPYYGHLSTLPPSSS